MRVRVLTIGVCIIVLPFFFGRTIFAFPPARPGLINEEMGAYKTTGLPLVKMGDHVSRPGKKINLENLRKEPSMGAIGSPRTMGIDSTVPSIIPAVFLVDFSDRPQHRNASDFPPLFFGTGPQDKSVANYWSEVSYGSFTATGNSSDVLGWFTPGVTPGFNSSITQNSQLTDIVFGLNSANFLTLFNDLISFLDSSVDFSRYDADGDGVVDSAIFVHAGWGAEDSGDTVNDIYSQALFFGGSPITVDGVTIEDVVIVPEEKFYNDPQFVATGTGVDDGDEDLVGIGVIVHEMGHLMGLPDLYPVGATDIPGNFSGVGVFDLMGFGLWGNNLLADQDTPSHLSAWSKSFLGWLTPVDLTSTSFTNILPPLEARAEAFKILINGPGDGTQYILIENRQKAPDPAAPVPAWLFDNSLPGTGILIWHIDEAVITANIASNTVNLDPDFKGVDVEEADGGDELDQIITGATPNDRAIFFGDLGDFFSSSTQVFDRNNPNPGVNETNSSPIISGNHPVDFGIDVALTNFTVFSQNIDIGGIIFTVDSIFFDLTISGTGIPPSVPDWKTFNQVSTDPSEGFTNGPIVSDDIGVIGQDSSNAIWFGTEDSGISRLFGREFERFNTTFDGLPSDDITAFAFDDSTGVMWVGTDNGLARMRNRGTGFEVITVFTTIPNPPFNSGLPSNVINDLALDGNGFLRVATASGMALIDDGGTDSDADNIVVQMLTGKNLTSVVVSPGGNINPALYDPVIAADDLGNLYRSVNGDPRVDTDFRTISLPLNPIINDLALNPAGQTAGTIWVGTQNNGTLVYDDKLTEDVTDDELDPLDVDTDGITDETYFITTSDNITSNRVTGVTFQEITGQTESVAYLSHRNDGINDGGVTRVDLNFNPADRFVPGLGLTVFREDPLVLPEDETNGPPSNLVKNAFTDFSGNIWFSTDSGASRFGNAGILTLDATVYFNTDAIATVILEDAGLNFNPGSTNLAVTFVKSDSDQIGFVLVLQETGFDTGIFSGQFGFTEGATVTAGALPALQVANNNTVTASYNDSSPLGERLATALWRKIVPFDDDLLIEGCFIATAAFGSPVSPMVKIFRDFRDCCLTTNNVGRFLIATYYSYSPHLAKIVSKSPFARFAARSILVPLALFTDVNMKSTQAEKIIIFVAGIVLILLFEIIRRKRSPFVAAETVRVRRKKSNLGDDG